MWRAVKRVWTWIGNWSTFQALLQTEFVRTLLIPTLITMVTLGGGLVQHQPIMWIMMAAAVVFMTVTFGMLGASLYRERKSPQNKLTVQTVFQVDLEEANAPLIGPRHTRRAMAKQRDRSQTLSPTQLNPQVSRTIEKGQLGVEVTNNATFPISCYLAAAETEIEGERPPRSTFPKPTVLIQPGTRIRLCDDAIELDGMQCQRLAGRIELLVKYGLPGKEIFELNPKGAVDIVMEHFGFVSQVILGIQG